MRNQAPKLWLSAAVAALLLGFAGGPLPLKQVESIDDLFGPGAIPSITVELNQNALQSLRDNSRRNVSAGVRIDPGHVLSAQVHLKGHGTFRTIDQKPSFTFTFSDGAISGLEKVHLNNSLEDATYVQEQLGSELFRSFGIPAPRTSHVRVLLNGRNLGLYVVKEGFTRAFLSRSFSAGNGDLHEGEISNASSLAKAASEPDLQVRRDKLNDLIDLDRFVSFMAVEVLICHWDGYSTAANNVRVYHDPSTAKFHFLPTGMDQLFGNPRYPTCPEMTGLLARAVMEIPGERQRFKTRLKQFAQEFDPAGWTKRAEYIAGNLRPALSRTEYEEVRENVRDLCERIRARASFFDHELVQLARAKEL